ncbi:DUF5675 family protein [Bacteroides ilei]|jgi:hypothetical protein|uniref:DUF5675 family protein n=1 Tax=Bacteroides ilei TaxID=1907658 RepID=UPI0009309DEF|nr:DUF5675 family protein [Bacteroides ilei]
MEMTLTRIAKRPAYTIGRLEIDGTYFCDTLEPTWRDVGWGRPGRKVAGRTAIPEGRYAVAVTLSPRFGRWLPLLLHVPMFEGIRIHAGNSAQDTAGCILPGLNTVKGRVTDSRLWERRIVRKLAERPEGEGVWITIR